MTSKYKKVNPGTTTLEPKEFSRTWEIVRLIVIPEKRHSNKFINTSQFSQAFEIIVRKSFLNLLLAVKIYFSKKKIMLDSGKR